MLEKQELIDLYLEKLDKRKNKIDNFFTGDQPFLVVQRPNVKEIWSECNEIDYIVKNNLAFMEKSLKFEFADELPYMEAWIGVGVYANAFGCEYLWRKGEAPATHYKFMELDEVANIEYPDWKKSPIMNMVIDTIDKMVEVTDGKIPISLTDTQSPFDTATLIVDATNFMIGCYENPVLAKEFLDKISNLVIEFSKVQQEHIGNLISKPGHIMTSSSLGHGISLSDDNLSFCAAEFNEEFSLPYNQKIGEAFGGVAIHSCGNWAHTMSSLKKFDQVFMIDCAGSLSVDPSPCVPKEIREGLANSNLIAKVRVGNNLAEIDKILPDLVSKNQKYIIELEFDEANAEKNYNHVNNKLTELYS